MDYPYGPLGKLLLMTAQRLNEVAQMQWCEIDRDNALWVMSADRTKSGRETEVPLSSLALEILDDLPRFTQGDYIFTATSGQRSVTGFSKMKTRADNLSGVTGWRLHDLRRTARTGLAEIGIPEIIAEMVMNHAPRNVLAKIYNRHEYAAEKRDALERWALRLREITEPPPENVVKLKAKR
jgi:integrase